MTSELHTRVVSAAMLGTAVIVLTLLHTLTFTTMIGLGVYLLLREWRGLTRSRGAHWMPMGVLYVGFAAVSLIYLRMTNLNILLALFAIVWSGDTAAYLVGRVYGRHKIAPQISPGKSWEGLAASIVVSALVAAGLGSMAPIPHALLGAGLAVVGLLGDLFESALKRHAGVKDSGTLIPGHGGLFDRVDALLPCAIISAIALFLRLNGG